MLLVDDNVKEILEEHGIGYGEYMSPGDVYLTAILNMAVETAIKYNEDNIEDPVVVENYINFIVAEWASVKSRRRWGAAKRR